MAQVKVKYNPYRLVTEIEVNGRAVQEDDDLYKLTKGKRLQEWVGEFPDKLREAVNSMSFALTFYGMDLDWDDFKDAFQQAEKKGSIKIESMDYIAPEKDGDTIQAEVERVFTELQEGPVEAFKDRRLQDAFDAVNNSTFPVNVIATMSSGKSTLINALLGNKLMPSKNEACTATITEILDSDNAAGFSAAAYDGDGNVVREIPVLTYEEMDVLNADEQITRVEAQGNIPFLDSRSMALKLVDTPGPNNAQNQEHRNITYHAITNGSKNLILYVLNATQLNIDDDDNLLQFVSEQIREGGKQMRDRFLFVVNKMDQFDPENENIEESIQSAKKHLAKYGIQDPQIFPCSAFTALNIRTYFKNIDIEKILKDWPAQRKLSVAARDTLPMIDKLVYYESMHLERYSTLSPSAQQALELRLQEAIEHGDIKEQALIHSGICSIEAAIMAYVTKYAKTRKIKDLVETFENVLESSQVLATAKDVVAKNKDVAEVCAKHAEAVRRKIDEDKKAAEFKAMIDMKNPRQNSIKEGTKLAGEVHRKSSKVFTLYPETIQSKDEASRMILQFAEISSDTMAEMTAKMEQLIRTEIVEFSNQLIQEYQNWLTLIDEETAGGCLEFTTFDLIKGELNKMEETVRQIGAKDTAYITIEKLGKTTYEEKHYWEKVGETEEEILVGTHEEKVGTRKVWKGRHEEKTGLKQQVLNPDKRWWKLLTPRYIEQDVTKWVDDFREEDVYMTVKDYKTITKDVLEERIKKIENFSVEKDDIQTELIGTLRDSLDKGLKNIIDYASEEVASLKEQFKAQYDRLDQIIKEKYAELTEWATQEKLSQDELKKNQQTLDWLNTHINKINEILNI